MSVAPTEDIDYFNTFWGRQAFIGGYAGIRSPEISNFVVRAGAGYYSRLNSEEILLKSQYADYANAISSGLKWYVGADYRLFASHFGPALYARLQYTGLSGIDGLLSLGLSLAI